MMRRIMGMALGLVLTATVGLVTAAPASAWTYESKHCVGDAVDRCVALRRNSDGTLYARGSAGDDPNRSGDYSVRMVQVSYSFVRAGNPPSGVTVSVDGDNGWNETSEWIATRALPVPCGTRVTATAKAEWMNERTKERASGTVSTTATVC
jgi:hypothetical protein